MSAGTGDGDASGIARDLSDSAGDVPRGVNSGLSSGLSSRSAALSAFGVLGPAVVGGACTVFPSIVALADSTSGTGAFASGE